MLIDCGLICFFWLEFLPVSGVGVERLVIDWSFNALYAFVDF